MSGAQAATPRPKRVGRYVLGDCIGTGGMAEVFVGNVVGVRGFRKPVAIKRLNTGRANDPASIDRLIEEAKLLSGLQHGNIVDVVDLVHDGTDVFLVMEYVDGPSLRQLIGVLRPERLPLSLVTFVIHAAAVGLAFAHARPGGAVIHADISPSNLLLTRTGEVRVADFGIARREGVVLGAIEGKPSYMAPEQAAGDRLTPRADVYALGVVLHELLSGERPRPGSVGNVFAIDGIPDDLLRLVARCLADDPGHRPSMLELASALTEIRFANSWRDGAAELAELIGRLPLPARRMPHSVATASLSIVPSDDLAPADAWLVPTARRLAHGTAPPIDEPAAAESLPTIPSPAVVFEVAPTATPVAQPAMQPPASHPLPRAATQPPTIQPLLRAGTRPPPDSASPIARPPTQPSSNNPQPRAATQPPPDVVSAASVAIGRRRDSVATPIPVPSHRTSRSRWGMAAIAFFAVAAGLGTVLLDRDGDALAVDDGNAPVAATPISVEPVAEEIVVPAPSIATADSHRPVVDEPARGDRRSSQSTAEPIRAAVGDGPSFQPTAEPIRVAGDARSSQPTAEPTRVAGDARSSQQIAEPNRVAVGDRASLQVSPAPAKPIVTAKPARTRTIKPPIHARVEPAPTVAAEPEVPTPVVSAGSLVSRGTDLYIHGKLQPAREAFEAAIAAEPTNAAAHRGLGIVCQRAGAAAQAIAAYRRYLELRPNAQDAAVIEDRIASLGGGR